MPTRPFARCVLARSNENQYIQMKHRFLTLAAFVASPLAHGATVTFEDLSPGIPYAGGGSYENGANLSGSFTSGPLTLSNSYNATWGSWSGWSYSTTTDDTTAGFDNQYSAFPGSGAGGSATYAIAYADAAIEIPTGYSIGSLAIANTTYAALSMRDGDAFSKQFGGPSGDDPDLFQITFTGYLAGNPIGSVTADLADFTFADNSQDYILGDWLQVDLSSLSSADLVRFSYSSTDVGDWGINTPTYIAVDSIVLTAVPEPSALLLAALAPLAVLRRRR